MKRNAAYWVDCVVDSVTFESIFLQSRRNPKLIHKFYTDLALYGAKGDSIPFPSGTNWTHLVCNLSDDSLSKTKSAFIFRRSMKQALLPEVTTTIQL
jgi:hypothetical protein